MLVPVSWLKDYVDINIDEKELADRLTMSGSHVDSIINKDKGIKNVVVGQIKKIWQHPNADKLVVTTVDIGSKEVQIVTGAKNISEGDYIPVSLVGAKLADGTKIKKGKLRGEVSEGMMCSLIELGKDEQLLPESEKLGIHILKKPYPLGIDINEVIDLEGYVIEFEITPNRPDCLSIVGMARETAATLNSDMKQREIKIEKETGDISEYLDGVEIEDKELCRRYYAKVVKNVKIEPSPQWMQNRLMDCGMRPINNIVDITNYVMLEYGQPLHAFDARMIDNKKIIVRRANIDEKITTLDSVERKLNDSMLVIADENKAIALAGVMGGENSEIVEDTNAIIIESANFNGRNVRLTAKEVGLRTEASSKYEKDLDPGLSEIAALRVCQLIEMLGAGEVVKGYYDERDKDYQDKVVTLNPANANKLLGSDIPTEKMVEILNKLELRAELKDGIINTVVPTFRQDINIETDLIEEVGRIYGFHNIEPKPLLGALTKGDKSTLRNIEDVIKDVLTGAGLNEITTYSFISPKAYDKICLPEHSMKRKSVKLLNPLGEDYSVMRTTLIPNSLEVLSKNYKHGVEKAYVYEVGKIFIQKGEVASLPYEASTVTIGMYKDVDFYKLKAVVELVLERLGIKDYEYEPEKQHKSFHPGRTGSIVKGNHVLGILGEIHPSVLKNYGMKERAYVAELDIEMLALLSNMKKKYTPLPKYPAISRDIAVVVSDDVLVKDIEKVINNNGGKLVESVALFDIYKGSQIPEDKKSVAYSIKYRSYEKTLTDDDIAKVHQKILDSLERELGASQR
ncbi:phenylalanine--tRNA ligase subunit beta [Clostridiaceae bacterium M8S5]|nr:phenylalanine--tRNA ligase subunit beta [Clostridiaceae bacterium M8S5]